MADPVTLTVLSIACGTVELAGSIAKFLDEREERHLEASRRAAEYEAEREQAAQAIDNAESNGDDEEQEEARRQWQEQEDARIAEVTPTLRDEMFFVLAVLGQRLFRLEVVALEHIPEVLRMLVPLWPNTQWKGHFQENLDDSLQCAVVAAMTFCAECWPMHIYRGFGAAVLNKWDWAFPDPENPVGEDGSNLWITGQLADEVDHALASLKSLPRPPLLTKIPVGISQHAPNYCTIRGSQIRKLEREHPKKAYLKFYEHYVEALEAENKYAKPQPRDGRCKILERGILWSSWDRGFACKLTPYANYADLCLLQSDPGRMLYALTIGGWLELEPGEAREVHDDPIRALVRWLHGLRGMTFDIILYSDLEFPQVKYKRSTLKYFKSLGVDLENQGRQYPTQFFIVRGKPSDNLTPVYTPSSPSAYSAASPTAVSGIEDKLAATSIQEGFDSKDPVAVTQRFERTVSAPAAPTRHRPAPQPPLPKVQVLCDFAGEDPGELSVKGDQILYVVKDYGDGWLEARLPDGASGLIPKSFTFAV